MEITKTIPAHNPADSNSLDGLNNILVNKISMNIDCVIPGIVQSYDKVTNRAVIKPAITGVASQGQKVSKPAYNNIPVYQNPFIKIPIHTNMTGWLVACDRNISLFKQNLTESAPNDYRKHKFEDAFFIPDSINSQGVDNLTIDAGSTNLDFKTSANLTINNTAGLNGSYTISNGTVITVTKGIITGIT